MKKIKILILSLASSIGALGADLDITPGSLEGLLDEATKNQTELKLRGSIDARDLAALENLSSDIKTLDLSQVKITSLTMPTRTYFGRTLFNEDEIPPYAFFKSAVETLVLPANLFTVCDGAFAGSEIREIVIPDGVSSIGDYAFNDCKNLERVTLPASLSSIGKGVFANCTALKDINLSSTKISSIPERAFSGAVMLENVSLPAAINSVGREAFSHTAIQELSLKNVAEFEPYALSGMPFLKALTINPAATIADGLLMDNTSLASLSGVPDMVPDYFAANCTEFNTQEGVTTASSLGRYSFANTKASKLMLLSPLSSIERGALAGLSNLTQIDVTDLGGAVPQVDENSFEGLVQPDIQLIVDDRNIDVWKNDPVWSLFKITAADPSGMGGIEASNTTDISVVRSGGYIVVSSPAPLTDVRVFTADGRIAFIGSPNDTRLEIPVDSLPNGVIIITASDADGDSISLSLLL